MRRFEPVWLPEDRVPRDRMSVTFGRAYNVCPRAGFLYQSHKGGASTANMERGSALHRVLELGTLAMIEQGEGALPPEVVKSIVNEVLADSEYRCPLEEHDYIRECAYRWAEETELVPDEVIAVETLVVLQVSGFQIRMKIDRAELKEAGALCSVVDYKSSRNLPKFEDIGRKRPDGSIAAKDYQLVLYGLGLAFGTPVRVETCSACGGKGWTVAKDDHTSTVEAAAAVNEFYSGSPMRRPCRVCSEHGVVEVIEPFTLAKTAQKFELTYLYPGIETSDGTMAKRSVTLTRLELHEYMDSLRAQIEQVRHSVATGDWPASYGAHCSECPCRPQCPIPAELRDYAGTINTDEEAREAAERLAREKDDHAARRKELIAYVKSRPEKRLRYGRDQVLEVGYQERVTLDKDGLFEAVERAIRYGEAFDRADFEKRSNSTPIVDRRLTEEELAAEIAAATTTEGS